MHGGCYQLDTSILAILSPPNGERIAVTIPKGAFLRAVASQPNGTRTFAEWDGQEVMLFTEDLRERGTSVHEASA